MDMIVGTAGHIDHGKTALVRELTGTDTDRLPEEKKRGITIDLGFAELSDGDLHFGFVDVPGHERFVKNMLAGASGIDIVMLVVAADEGVMPQTREHFDICRLLELKRGLIAVTKKDLVDDELLELVKTDIAEFVRGTFLDGAPIIPVSSKTGEGIETVHSTLLHMAEKCTSGRNTHVVRLPIDRSFAMKGFGTVVTGTLASGKIMDGIELEMLPARRRVRVRGIQTHGQMVSEAGPGRRTAVNLAGIDHDQIERGTLLSEPGILQPCQVFDAELEVLSSSPRPLRTRQRIRLHLGTAEVLARLTVIGEEREIPPGGQGFIQLRLESPIAAITGERFIIRTYSPQMTIAGGTMLRYAVQRFRRRNERMYTQLLTDLVKSLSEPAKVLLLLITDSANLGITEAKIRSITGWTKEVFETAASQLIDERKIVDCKGVFITADAFASLEAKAIEAVERLFQADRLLRSAPLESVKVEVFGNAPREIEKAVLASLITKGKLAISGDSVELPGRNHQLSESESRLLASLREAFTRAGLEVPKIDEVLNDAAVSSGVKLDTVRKLFHHILNSGELVRVNSDLCFSAAVMNGLIAKVRKFAETTSDRTIDVAMFKEIAGVSRKYAIPLLEYFDHQRITVRNGDKRVVL